MSSERQSLVNVKKLIASAAIVVAAVVVAVVVVVGVAEVVVVGWGLFLRSCCFCPCWHPILGLH